MIIVNKYFINFHSNPVILKRFIMLIPIIIWLISSTSSAQDLNQYLVLAAENNPGLKAKFYDYQAALERAPQVGALPDPQASFGYFIQPVETRVGPQQARISLSQMFPWFGALQARENVAVQEAKTKYEAFNEAKSHLYYQVKSAWYRLYFTTKAIDIISKNVHILNSFRNLALIKMESGAGSAADELRIEMELADLHNHLSLLNDEFQYITIEFYNLLNVHERPALSIPDTLHEYELLLSKEEIRRKIINNNHQLLLLDHRRQKYENEQIVAAKSGLPSFTIGVDYIFTGRSGNPALSEDINGKDAILFPKISFNLPLYRGKYKARVKEEKLRQLSTRAEKQDRLNVLQTIFEKTQRDYRDANRRITLFANQLQTADKVLRILESDYTARGGDFTEVLRMERKKLAYTLKLERARADKQSAIAYFHYLMGQ